MDDHWLVRPKTIRALWVIFIAILVVLVALDPLRHDAHFTIEALFGFGAWFGFFSCVVLVLVAKGLGLFLKRPDTYYDE
jgi:hypothetical protein